MDWLKTHGAKVLSFALTFLTAASTADPVAVGSLLGDQGQRWVTLGLAAATLAHTTLVKPPAAASAANASTAAGKSPP